MSDLKTHVNKIIELLSSKNPEAAKVELATGLEKYPNHLKVLIVATDAYRASSNREKSLEYSKLLITHHPDNWNGYARAAQDLVALKRFKEAQEQVQAGLEKIPNQVNLLVTAADVYRASGNRAKSLEYSELLITHHPDNWNGYARAAQDLVVLKNFDEAIKKINLSKKITNHTTLSTIENDIKNDMNNLDTLFAQSNISHPKSTSKSTYYKKNMIGSNSQETFCFLIRCTHYKDELAQQLQEQIAKHIAKPDIWFVHDSDDQDKSINLISVSQFRKTAGFDWSICESKGWMFGDFCYYAALHSDLEYDNYFLVEDDVRFTGEALAKLLLETKDDPTDFLATCYCHPNSQKWPWWKRYTYAHPGENSECVGCLFPLTRASNRLIKYLFNERRKEFQAFYEKHEFSVIEANKYFSNDEAFVCNKTFNSNNFTIDSIPKSLTNSYFCYKSIIHDISDIEGDHIIHKYRP